MTDYEKQEVEKLIWDMFVAFQKDEPSKCFYSQSSIKDALDEYGYETIRNCFSLCMESAQEGDTHAETLFNFSNRVTERCFNETLDYMEKHGYGDYRVDEKGEILFILKDEVKDVALASKSLKDALTDKK